MSRWLKTLVKQANKSASNILFAFDILFMFRKIINCKWHLNFYNQTTTFSINLRIFCNLWISFITVHIHKVQKWTGFDASTALGNYGGFMFLSFELWMMDQVHWHWITLSCYTIVMCISVQPKWCYWHLILDALLFIPVWY